MSDPVLLPVLILVDDDVALLKALQRFAERHLRGRVDVEMFSDPDGVEARVRSLRTDERSLYIISDGDMATAQNLNPIAGPQLLRNVRMIMGEPLFLGGCLHSANEDLRRESQEDGF